MPRCALTRLHIRPQPIWFLTSYSLTECICGRRTTQRLVGWYRTQRSVRCWWSTEYQLPSRRPTASPPLDITSACILQHIMTPYWHSTTAHARAGSLHPVTAASAWREQMTSCRHYHTWAPDVVANCKCRHTKSYYWYLPRRHISAPSV